MDEALKNAVRRRARDICEYCHLPANGYPTPFEIEHVVPRQHGGRTVAGNLAFACLHCNRCKGPNLSGVDRAKSGMRLTPLFNPRRHKWSRHFQWRGPFLAGRTATGRVTVEVLGINDPVRVAVRQALMEEGRFSVDT
jgi:hypothetical protein